jgi:homoserine O-acetyltransferase
MDWQTPDDTRPSTFITEDQARTVIGMPPATGAWREGDPIGQRKFIGIDRFLFESGDELPTVRIAYETWGTLNRAKDNAVLVLHALTGDSHTIGTIGAGHVTAGWWNNIVGSGKAIDTDRWFVVTTNLLGGCQGSTGPASIAPDGYEWGPRFPYTTIRDHVSAQVACADALGIERWAGVIGGSMGGMHALEWGIMHPNRVERLGLIATSPYSTAEQISLNFVQLQAVRNDPGFHSGHYYDVRDGEGPHHGLALARRMAILTYRNAAEFNGRFDRSWQSEITPLGGGGRFAVESYLDFHGNTFTRRFDANSYITLVESMNAHDVSRGRDSLNNALSNIKARTLIVGIDSDRLFSEENQYLMAREITGNIDGDMPVMLHSEFGHDGFLIEQEKLGAQLRRLFEE